MSQSSTADREIITSRIINAPRELVWKAWTDPNHLIHWWGPNGFTNTFEEYNFKPGGVWKFTMHSAEGVNYPNQIIFKEIQALERITFTHGNGDNNPETDFENIITFESLSNNQTKLTMQAILASPAALEAVKKHGAVEGGQQTLARLDQYANRLDRSQSFVEIKRTFKAPRHLVWKAWTQADHLTKWWGPKGSIIKIAKFDFTPGGVFHYSMSQQSGQEIWGKFTFTEINPEENIVYINSFSDANGGLTENPWIPNWPKEILNSILLTEENGQTTVSIKGGPINATEEQFEAYKQMAPNIQAGFKGTFDQLEELLSKM